jgi:hypothetical protein
MIQFINLDLEEDTIKVIPIMPTLSFITIIGNSEVMKIIELGWLIFRLSLTFTHEK